MPEKQSSRLFLTFSVLSLLYIFSLFYRVSNAVIAPNLMTDLNLDAEALGLLGGAFFYSFALIQVPLGPMLDRMEARYIISGFGLTGALGAFLFAFGKSFSIVLVGRTLTGVGMACMLIASLKVFIVRFPPKKFATLMGAFLSVGSLGNILAASPLAYATSLLGWRTTFVVAGSLTALFSFLVFWVMGNDKKIARIPASSPAPEPEVGIMQSMRFVLGSFTTWRIAAISFCRYGTYVSLQGLWLGPYLIDTKGYPPVEAGNVLILLAIGTIIGSPIGGWLCDRGPYSREGITLWGMGLYCLSLFPLIGILKMQNLVWYAPVFFFMGVFNGFGVLVLSHATEIFPASISGTVMALVNFFHMIGGAIFMSVLGSLIKSFPRTGRAYPDTAYHISFLICFLSMAASLIFYLLTKKNR